MGPHSENTIRRDIMDWDEELGCFYEDYFVDEDDDWDELDPPIHILEGEEDYE